MQLLLRFILTHVLGDYLLQPGTWSRRIESRKATSVLLYVHFMVYVAVSLLIVPGWWPGLLFAGSHIAIRLVMLYMPLSSRRRFFVDNMLHAVAAVVLVAVLEHVDTRLAAHVIERNLPLIAGILLLTKPSSALIRHTISRWNPVPDGESPDSLEKAGTWIGILERLFVFLFVLSGEYSAIGFLLAAKSVFRFGDLREAHDRKLTEYILIGTLLSVGVALITALAVQALL